MALNTRERLQLPLSSKRSHSHQVVAPPPAASAGSVFQVQGRETGGERLKLLMERKVAVVYYLSRNGQLEHPHFVEVPLSSDRLYLRDVMARLTQIRGKNMASMYSWSSKRSYKNGYVWQDLSEDDFICPSNGHEYILKGSELLQLDDASCNSLSACSSFRKAQLEISSSRDRATSYSDKLVTSALMEAAAQSWSSPTEYKVYRLHPGANRSTAGNAAADMATQTGEERIGVRRLAKDGGGSVMELRGDLSPPSSSSSTETTLGKATTAEGVNRGSGLGTDDQTVGVDRYESGRMRVSDALMQLITCGSGRYKEEMQVGGANSR